MLTPPTSPHNTCINEHPKERGLPSSAHIQLNKFQHVATEFFYDFTSGQPHSLPPINVCRLSRCHLPLPLILSLLCRVVINYTNFALLGSSHWFYPLTGGSMKLIALVLYEYLVTFDDELAFIWRSPPARKSTGLQILFCLNRYIALGVAIIGAISDMVPRVSSSSTYGFLDAPANNFS